MAASYEMQSRGDVWSDLRAWIISSFSGSNAPGSIEDASDPDQVILLMLLPSGNSQKMLVRRLPVGDEDEWLEIATVVCEEHEFDARSALIQNGGQVIGHLSLDPDSHLVWFRHTLQMKYLAPPSGQFAGTLGLMINVGDYTEHQLTGQDKW